MAAGQGFKTFATGDVLSASDVNGYLMQGVLVFADSAERDAEITSPEEGQFAYLKDTNVTTYYTGSVWANLDTTGMTNPMTTTGDVIYSSSGSTPARLGIGTANQVLRVNAGATAPEWATAAAGGFTELASGSLSSTGVNLTSISQDYIDLYLILRNMNITSAGQVLNMRFNNDSTGIYQISNSSVNGYQVAATSTSMGVGIGNLSTSGDNSFAITINDYKNSSFKIGTAISATVENAGDFGLGDQRFMMRSATAISQINLFMTSGNFSGSYILYGVK
jgi:hypothetical protein